MASFLSRGLRSASSLSKIMSVLGPFAYLLPDAHFSYENELLDLLLLLFFFFFFLCGVGVTEKAWQGYMVSDISKRVPLRLLISCSTILRTALIFVTCEKEVFDVVSFVHGEHVAFVHAGNAHFV